MNTRILTTCILISVVFILLVGVGLGFAQAPGDLQAKNAPEELAGTAFTYQGRLTSSDVPYTGTCDLGFALFDAFTLGTQQGGTITAMNFPVNDGYFTVQLDFGSGILIGDGRWLEIWVRCPAGSGDYTQLTPRQELTPAPLALALPGLWTQQNATSPNLIGGNSGNWVTSGVYGAAIGGGGEMDYLNRVTDIYGTVSGGSNNQAGDALGTVTDIAFATVGGGSNNNASGVSSTVSGGFDNDAAATDSSVGGGSFNTASGVYATASGGHDNNASGASSSIGGGFENDATGQNSSVGGGYLNIASGGGATIGGGNSNNASGASSAIGGGYNNDATGQDSSVGGGNTNLASGRYAAVGGGITNIASANSATVSGGISNTATYSYTTVGGGYGNSASWDFATVSGGNDNAASFYYATVGGGNTNEAGGASSTIGGGEGNFAWDYATVGGGLKNSSTENYATISGGSGNVAMGEYATISGGYSNEANGDYATAAGGYLNLSGGDYSFAAGRRAKANKQGCFVWGDSTVADVACDVINRWVARASGGVYFYTNSGLTTGSYLAAGSGTWADLSDKNLKENIETVDEQELLENLVQVPITTWNYKSQDDSIRHIGPMAQDFYAAFGVGEDETHITTIDANGVALAAIQGLYAENQELKVENAEQQAQIDDLESRLSKLEKSSQAGTSTQNRLSFNLPWLLTFGLVAVGGTWAVRRQAGGGK